MSDPARADPLENHEVPGAPRARARNSHSVPAAWRERDTLRQHDGPVAPCQAAATIPTHCEMGT